MDAPYEIWAYVDGEGEGRWMEEKDRLSVPYRRADLCADPALMAEAVEVLRYLLDDIQDYQRINNLGGENNHSQVRARAFLSKLENRHDR